MIILYAAERCHIDAYKGQRLWDKRVLASESRAEPRMMVCPFFHPNFNPHFRDDCLTVLPISRFIVNHSASHKHTTTFLYFPAVTLQTISNYQSSAKQCKAKKERFTTITIGGPIRAV